MDEFKKILTEAIEALRQPKNVDRNQMLQALDNAYNRALDDVIEIVIKKIPN